jgi:hypothetical protein
MDKHSPTVGCGCLPQLTAAQRLIRLRVIRNELFLLITSAENTIYGGILQHINDLIADLAIEVEDES